MNASRPSEHPPVRRENAKPFRWDHRLQIQNPFIVHFSFMHMHTFICIVHVCICAVVHIYAHTYHGCICKDT